MTARRSHHDKHWDRHPAVPTGESLTLGDRAADVMRTAMGSWTFLFWFLGFMAAWMVWNGVALFGLGWDPYPFILLNLGLSTLAGLQGVILLIAAKRQDAVNAALAQHDRDTVAALLKLNRQQTLMLQQLKAHIMREAE